jgi:hypothetical protein
MNGTMTLAGLATILSVSIGGVVFAADPALKAPVEASSSTRMDKVGAGPMAVSAPMAERQAQIAAKAAESRIRVSPSQVQAVIKAVRSGNKDAARKILIQNGFSEKQLAGAEIVLDDQTGGANGNVEQRVVVTINVRCCPLTVRLTIAF